MENEIVEVVKQDLTDLTARPHAGLLETNTDNILMLAEKADKYIAAMNKIMSAALKITDEYDWCLVGGKPYLQESGATKVARLFGVSIQLIGQPIIECDTQGYKTFTYKAKFILNGQFIECEGSRSMKEDFFAKTKTGLKNPDEIDERDVKMAAYTNCLNNGIKRLIPGLRNINIDKLTDAGLNVDKISGYTFKEGSRGGTKKNNAEESGLTCESCGKAVTQKVASFSQGRYGKILCMDCQKTDGAVKPQQMAEQATNEQLPF